MQKRFRNSKRTLTKRVTSINLYVDQATQIQAIMEATGSRMEAPLVRQLVDEALAARRRKIAPAETPTQPSSAADGSEVLQTLQTILLRILEQGEMTCRIESVTMELLQEALTEARATRLILWDHLVAPELRLRGKADREIAELFDAATGQAQDFAYGLAVEVRNQIMAPDLHQRASVPSSDGEDRQGWLYELTDTSDRDPQAP